MAYQKKLTANIQKLHDQLSGGSYRHSCYQPFIIHDPKQRHIHKAGVADRPVHQMIVTAVEPLFEKRFIHDSYSCRVSKGAHTGVRRLRLFLRQASRNNSKTVYALKCDVRKFFDSVDHHILMKLLRGRIGDEKTLALLRMIINSFGAENSKGLPLGNVTSQLFANVYLHELDWFVKQTLGQKYYLRYCDDFVIVSGNRSELVGLIEKIDTFLRDALLLQLHPNKVSIHTWHQGIDFLGYLLKPETTVIRTKTKRRILKKVADNNLSSYLGICSHANEHYLSEIISTKAWVNE
jgi:retron-type reverse transcriptase